MCKAHVHYSLAVILLPLLSPAFAVADEDATASYAIDVTARLASDNRTRGVSDSLNRPGAKVTVQIGRAWWRWPSSPPSARSSFSEATALACCSPVAIASAIRMPGISAWVWPVRCFPARSSRHPIVSTSTPSPRLTNTAPTTTPSSRCSRWGMARWKGASPRCSPKPIGERTPAVSAERCCSTAMTRPRRWSVMPEGKRTPEAAHSMTSITSTPWRTTRS